MPPGRRRHGRALAVFAGATTFQVFTSVVGSDIWRPLPGASGPAQGASQEEDRNPQIAIEGSAAYVASNGIGEAASGSPGGGVLLSGPADGSVPWQRLPVPCPPYDEVQMPVAAAPAEVVLGCGGDDTMGHSPKYVYVSADGGRGWATRPDSDPLNGESYSPGFLDDIAVTPAGTIVASGTALAPRTYAASVT